jgi:protein SCO1/2
MRLLRSFVAMLRISETGSIDPTEQERGSMRQTLSLVGDCRAGAGRGPVRGFLFRRFTPSPALALSKTHRTSQPWGCSLGQALLVGLITAVLAPVCPRDSTAQPASTQSPDGRRAVPNTIFLDQNGNIVHFYSDLVRDKTLLVNFIFTRCTGSCPLSGMNFAQIQGLLAARGDRSIALISISTDPEDTPDKLKHWAARFGAQPGWTLLSGSEAAVDEVARALTSAPAKKGEHVPAVLIGDDATGRWTRVYGLQTPAELVAMAKAFRTNFDPLAP